MGKIIDRGKLLMGEIIDGSALALAVLRSEGLRV